MENVWDHVYGELFGDDVKDMSMEEKNYRGGVMRDVIGGVKIS